MQKFRKKIEKRRNIAVLVSISFLVIVGILAYLVITGDENEMNSFVQGYQLGFFLGIEGVLIFNIMKSQKALKNEEELKALYVKEHDERVLLISQKASSLTVIMMLIGLGIATVISGFFNSTIFLTLVVVTFILACVMIGTKRYYHKKF